MLCDVPSCSFSTQITGHYEDRLSLSGYWMVTKSAGFIEDRTGACGCCVWWPVWGCAASFPATTLWNIPWSRAEVERNRRPYTATLAECLLHCLIFGHKNIYTSDFVVLYVDQLGLWNKSATHQELVCTQHAAFVLSYNNMTKSN